LPSGVGQDLSYCAQKILEQFRNSGYLIHLNGVEVVNPEYDNYANDSLMGFGKEESQQASLFKPTNPKDVVGVKKAPISTVPLTVLVELGVAMLEGARKYGRHNYRVDKACASVYIDATWRHLSQFWEGEDIDADSGLSHITKAIASLVVLRDAMINSQWVDDRPPKIASGFFTEMNKKAAAVVEKYPNAKAAFTEVPLG